MRKILIFVSIICLLALVGCAVMPTAATLPPTQTATVVPSATATPSLPKPVQSPNLQTVNYAAEVFENGTWVVKNADGKVTANWDETTSKWVYNMENVQIVFGGATKPNSELGRDGGIDSNINFIVPDSWKSPLTDEQIDPNPIVPLGVVYQYVSTGSAGSTKIFELGVDFRGIELVQPAGTAHTTLNRYVAGFTISDPNHPDMLYVITVPIIETKDIGTSFNLDPQGKTTAFGILTGSGNINDEQLVQLLLKSSTIGKRIVLDIQVPVSGTTYSKFDYATPENQQLIDVLISGVMLPSIETSLTAGSSVRVPSDLKP